MNVMNTKPPQMMHRLAAPTTAKAWGAGVTHTDMAMPAMKPVPLTVAATPQNITIKLSAAG